MEFDEARQDRMRTSRAWLGIALVIVLLVAAGALFLAWRPGIYESTLAALTEGDTENSEPMARAGATPKPTEKNAAAGQDPARAAQATTPQASPSTAPTMHKKS